MILEQGLALDGLLGMTSLECEAQGESGWKQLQPTAGAAGRDAVPTLPELSDGDGQGVRWEATTTHRWCSREICCITIVGTL